MSRIYTDLGAELCKCAVCGDFKVLRFNVCNECDNALWLTQCSKKQSGGSEAHDIKDIKHIWKILKIKENR